MSSIGSLTFIRMEGPQIPALARDIRPINRSGVDGEGFLDQALKAPEVQVYTTAWATTLALANAAADIYAAWKGSKTTVIDDMGRTVYGVLVTDVRVLAIQTLTNSVPAGYYYQIRAVWTLKPTY